METNAGIPELRSRIDAERRRFESYVSGVETDAPTRYFASKALDAFERLDLDLRRVDYARRHTDLGD